MLRYAALNHELTKIVRHVNKCGSKVILDYARENCHIEDANYVSDVNMKIIPTIPGSMIALKMSSFGSKTSPHKAESHIRKIIQHSVNNSVKVCIDAEEIIYPKTCYDLMLEFNKYNLNVFKTYQMYRKDALKELESDILAAQRNNIQLGAKLVRGAYIGKQPNLFKTKEEVDASYRRALEISLNSGDNVHTLVATHNVDDIKYTRLCPHKRYKIAQLLGMNNDFPDYVYVPFGSLYELTPYLLRRLIERSKWS